PPPEHHEPPEPPLPEPAPPAPDIPVRKIQPEPPAPPAAPAGALSDETERPLGVRWARRLAHPSRPVVTPPADVRRGPVRARRSLGKRLFAIIALLVLAALLLGVVKVFEPFAGDPGVPVSVEIPPGSSVGEIGDLLAEAKVVDSSFIFELRATIAGKRGDLQSGTYDLRRDTTYGSAIAALSKAPSASKGDTLDVTIPEGRSRREIVPIVRDAKLTGDYLEASQRFSGALHPSRYDAPRGTRSLEGFLFPSTYELRRDATARDLVERQLAAFKENFNRVNLRRAHRRKLTAYDVLIVASMIEREAGVERERRLISAVIYNRLKDGVPLGIDATIRFILRKWDGALTRSDLAIDSPYNSRKRAGLPPTPIGNPGLASIRAAANPARVSYRYFVVKPGTCSHAFSTTPKQFQRDYDRYNAARQQAGKSPTTC
ncbi:MAG: endolytic transglycosylase MltG, partial [Solirubrobacteraceae bacterium]